MAPKPPTASSNVSHLFQVQLIDSKLTPQQRKQMGASIREATAKQLLKMDFRVEEIAPLFQKGAGSEGCGGGCRA